MDTHPQEPLRIDVPSLLRAKLPDVIQEYQRALTYLDSPLLKGEATRAQTLTHARQIVENTARHLGPGSDHPTSYDLARDIGAERAAAGVHPGESLRASHALFRSVIGALGDCVDASQTAAVAVTLQEVLTGVLRAAADSYAGVLLSRIHQAHIEERRRISRELHDRIGHGISVAQRNLELYEHYRDQEPACAQIRMERARAGLADAIDNVHQVISDLRLVEPLESLEKALRMFLESSATADLVSHIAVNGDETWVAPRTIEEVFLIVREALRNTIAHACAQHVLVRIDIAPHELRAKVVDDGRGFNPAVGRPGGTGLLSMRERATLLGGRLSMTSHPGRGTHVELSVTLSQGAER